MSERIRYVGLDVSKARIAVAVTEPDGCFDEIAAILSRTDQYVRLHER
jgi:hypothetical protein